AKIQLAGPLTCQWSLRPTEGKPFPSEFSLVPLHAQIYRMLLARAIAMVRALKERGAQAIFFIDEPALYGLMRTEARHVLGMQELRLMIQALSKEGAWVGIHCCSNTDWPWVMDLRPDILSLDVALSLE